MITETEMPYETMKQRVKTHKCGVCGGELNVAWGGSISINGYILRCGLDINHDTITDYKKPSKEYEEGNKLFRRLYGMDTKALMKMDKTAMLTRIGQAKFPKDLTKQETALMVEVSISYGLDPLMQELMIYQGNPYPTINARYRKAQETGKFDGIDTRPATEEERRTRHAKEGDYLYRAEVWVKGASHPFVGWGRVRVAETKGDVHLPIVKDPDRQAEKRAEAMGLRKAFSMPVPFQSWEEFEEQRAGEVSEVDGVGKVVVGTGKIIEGEVVKPDEEPEKLTPEEELEQAPFLKQVEEDIGAVEPLEKDETPVTPKQVAHIKQLVEDAGMDLAALGKYCNADKRWGIRDLKDLKVWQYQEIIVAFEKGKP